MSFKNGGKKVFVLLVLAFFLAINISYAQRLTGTMMGTLRDDTGIALPGATVKIQSPALIDGIKLAITTSSGVYFFRTLPPGTYTAIFSLQGLQTYKKKGIVISMGKTTTVDIVLKLTIIEESLTVIDESPVVDATEPETSKTASAIAANTPPSVGTIDPSSGSSLPNQEMTFTTTYKDPDGFGDLDYIMLMINTEINASVSCYVRYKLSTGKFFLMNDSGTEFLSSDQNSIIQNSYAKLDCSKTEVAYPDANTIQVKWFVTFKKEFSGNTYNTYLYAKDESGIRTGWHKKGTWKVDNSNSSRLVEQ
jgi:hypothetical protein